jgi:hypothetical protein
MTTTVHVARPAGAKAEVERPRLLPMAYTLVLAAVLTAATAYGLIVDGAYRVSPGVLETLPDVMRGQDLLTLLSVPMLVGMAHRARGGSLLAHLLWLGLLLYYAYSYMLYAFAPYSDAFLLYLVAIGMASYALLNGLLRLDMKVIGPVFANVPRRGLGTFLIVVAALFIAMWLAMLLPAIPGDLPDGRFTYDIASAVHVLDLTFVLPAVLTAGVLLLRRQPAGAVLGIVLLCKMVTLGLALVFMNLVFVENANVGETVTWVLIAAISTAWLIAVRRRMRQPRSMWIRDQLWQ